MNLLLVLFLPSLPPSIPLSFFTFLFFLFLLSFLASFHDSYIRVSMCNAHSKHLFLTAVSDSLHPTHPIPCVFVLSGSLSPPRLPSPSPRIPSLSLLPHRPIATLHAKLWFPFNSQLNPILLEAFHRAPKVKVG